MEKVIAGELSIQCSKDVKGGVRSERGNRRRMKKDIYAREAARVI